MNQPDNHDASESSTLATINPYQAPASIVTSATEAGEQYENTAPYKFEILTARGRLNRMRYFVFLVTALIAAVVVGAIVVWLGRMGGSDYIMLMIVPVVLAFIVFRVLFGIRRCHDFGKSGGFFALSFIPYVGVVFDLIVSLSSPAQAANQYGQPNPENSPIIKGLFWFYITALIGSALYFFVIREYI